MSAWHFILGAYLVTAIVIVVEVLAVRARHRAALGAALASRTPVPAFAGPTNEKMQ